MLVSHGLANKTEFPRRLLVGPGSPVIPGLLTEDALMWRLLLLLVANLSFLLGNPGGGPEHGLDERSWCGG